MRFRVRSIGLYLAISGVFLGSCGGGSSGGGQSSPPPPAQNPVPSVTSISPTTATAGGQSFTLTVSGANFLAGSVVRWNGQDRPTTFQTSTQVQAAIAASDIPSAGAAQVTVFNPSPGGGTSGAATFTISAPANPAPHIASISPTNVAAGAAAFTLTVNGTNFIAASTVSWSGQSRSTTFVSSTQVRAAISAADIAIKGIVQVSVSTPMPGGGTSTGLPFTITGTGGPVSYMLQTISAPWQEPGAMAVGNFDSGAIVDIAVTDLLPLNVHLGLGDGRGSFSFPPDLSLQAKNVIAADFNGDGKTDLAFVTLPLGIGLSEVAVFLGNSQGGFAQSWQYAYSLGSPCRQGQGQLKAMAIADVNGDGKADLLLGHAGFSVFLGKGDGTFVSPTDFGCTASANSEATGIVAGDFNRDGSPDLAVADARQNRLTVWLNDGTGRFTAQPALPTVGGALGSSLVAADFDLDGNPDLAAKAGPRTVFIYLGKGDGSFTGPIGIVSTAMNPSGATQGLVNAGDLNGDNIPDLSFTGPSDPNQFPGTSTVIQAFLNNGHAVFTATGGAAVSAGIGGIAAFDADGNGKIDLVMAASDEVLELLNK